MLTWFFPRGDPRGLRLDTGRIDRRFRREVLGNFNREKRLDFGRDRLGVEGLCLGIQSGFDGGVRCDTVILRFVRFRNTLRSLGRVVFHDAVFRPLEFKARILRVLARDLRARRLRRDFLDLSHGFGGT